MDLRDIFNTVLRGKNGTTQLRRNESENSLNATSFPFVIADFGDAGR